MVPEDAGADEQYTGGAGTTRVDQLLLMSVHYLAVTLSLSSSPVIIQSLSRLLFTYQNLFCFLNPPGSFSRMFICPNSSLIESLFFSPIFFIPPTFLIFL